MNGEFFGTYSISDFSLSLFLFSVKGLFIVPLEHVFLLQGKGYDIRQHVLACFGGAGGQHACAVARALGMQTAIIHR